MHTSLKYTTMAWVDSSVDKMLDQKIEGKS